MVLPAFISGLLAALLLTPLVRFLARKYGVLDHPKSPRKAQVRPVALLGGVAVLAAFALGILATRHGLIGGFLLPKQLLGILAGGAVLVFGGALDDRFDLPPRVQILFPVVASLIVIASGIGATVITNPLGGSLRLDAWSFELFRLRGLPYHLTLPADLFTFAWMMGMTYTTKLLDGLDGLVSGLGVIGLAVLSIYSLTPEMAEPELARLAMIGAGALGGFLFYNARPASIYLGEGGSTLVGYLLGALAILAGAKIGVMLMIVAMTVVMVMGVIMIVAVTMVMIVIVVMIMVVVMIVVVIMQVIMEILIVLHHRRQRFAADGLFFDIGQAGNVVDHLLLEQRAADLDDRSGILLVEFVDLALLARELADALHQRPVHLVVGDLDLLTLSDFRKHKPEPDAPRSNVLIFGTSFFLCGALVLEAPFMMLQIVGELAPDRVEFVLDERRRQFEIVAFVQRIEQSAFQLCP